MKVTVKRWLSGRGYGFIEPEGGGREIFVHHSEIRGAYELREGQKVEFEVQGTYKGPRAIARARSPSYLTKVKIWLGRRDAQNAVARKLEKWAENGSARPVVTPGQARLRDPDLRGTG